MDTFLYPPSVYLTSLSSFPSFVLHLFTLCAALSLSLPCRLSPLCLQAQNFKKRKHAQAKVQQPILLLPSRQPVNRKLFSLSATHASRSFTVSAMLWALGFSSHQVQTNSCDAKYPTFARPSSPKPRSANSKSMSLFYLSLGFLWPGVQA